MEYIDLSGTYNEELTRQAHTIISSTFEPLDVEPTSHWHSVLSADQTHRTPRIHTVVGVESGVVMSVCHIEYYARCHSGMYVCHCVMTGLLVYWAVKPGSRSAGLGTKVFNAMIKRLDDVYPDWLYLFAETHSADADDNVMMPIKRQQKFSALGFVQLPMKWYLPAMHDDTPAADNYVLVARPRTFGDMSPVPSKIVSDFLDDFFKSSFPWLSADALLEPWTKAVSQFEGMTAIPVLASPPWKLHVGK